MLGNSNHPQEMLCIQEDLFWLTATLPSPTTRAYPCPSGSPWTHCCLDGLYDIVVQSGTGVLGVAFLGASFTSGKWSSTIEAIAPPLGTYVAKGTNASCGGSWPYYCGITVVYEQGFS